MVTNRWLPYLLLLLAVLLPYSLSLNNQPIGDDLPMLRLRLAPGQVASDTQLWQENYWGSLDSSGLYRPLSLTLLYAQRAAFGLDNNAPFRLTSLLLYALCGMACFLFLSQLMGRLAAMAAALLFVLHPAHAEVALTTYGQVEILAALFLFAALYAHTRAARNNELLWTTAAAALFFLALLSKEVAVSFPALAILTRGFFLQPQSPGIRRWLGRFDALYLAPIAAYAFLRFAVLDSLGTPDNASAMAGMSLLRRLYMIATNGLGNYLRLTIFPESQSFLYDYFSSPMADAAWVVAALVLLALAARFLGRPAALFAAGWFAASWFIFSNLVIPTGIFVAERVLFLPVLAVCVLFGLAVEHAVSTRRPALLGLWILVLTLAAIQSGRTAWQWRTEESTYRASIAQRPDSPISRSILAIILIQKPQSTEVDRNEAEALAHFVLQQYPSVPEAHRALGLAAKARGDLQGAASHLTRALELRPRDQLIQADLAALPR